MTIERKNLGLRAVAAIAAIGGMVVLCVAPVPAVAKTAKQCAAEWRANKADNQAKGILEKDYVTQCRAGTAAAAPTTAPAATPAATHTPAAAPKPRETTAVAPAAGHTSEAMAKARCPTDTVVWVNEKSKIYHFSGHKDYGNTKEGTYMCERDAVASNNRAAKNEKHP
jgi:hypothetical protein